MNPSIVTVLADGGHGSGFLIHESGLFATNHHVVRNARWTAVEFANGTRVVAEIVALNPRFDVAILKVNRVFVMGLKPLELLEPEKPVRPGLRVFAFGSPLNQTFLMTEGIVSKVEEGELLGDFLIDHGNSGGPLVNEQGVVLGINTFGISRIAGAVRVELLRKTLTEVLSRLSAIGEPLAPPLPTRSKKSFPTEALKRKILADKLDMGTYQYDGGKFVVTILTPVMLAKVQVQESLQRAANRHKRRGKKIQDPTYQEVDEPFYEWRRTASELLENTVRFEIKPDFGMTTGSKWAMAFAAVGGAQSAQNLHVNMEFKAEFMDFKLYRDGKLIQPITPGRSITDASFNNAQFTFVDEAYSGLYDYDPEEFSTGSEFKMEIFDAREPDKVHKTLVFRSDSKLIRAIRSDFVVD